MQIHKPTETDYPQIVAIHNSLDIVWPQWPLDPQAWIEADRNRSPKCRFQRFVAIEDGCVVGAASYGNRLDDYHPQKYYINIEVLANYRRRGIGSALYDHLMEELNPYDPKILRTDILENQIQSYPFVQKRGFKEVWRETPVHLDVNAFDAVPYASFDDQLAADGIQITTLKALGDDPNRNCKAYDLYMTLAADVPSEYVEFTPIPFEDWEKMCIDYPGSDLAGFFVATHEGRYVALHDLYLDSKATVLMGGLLGTLNSHRGKRIGLSLIVRAITFAKEHGISVFKTCTAITNAPMQALFRKLGFAYDPQWLQCQKDLWEEKSDYGAYEY
ncbi:MAG: GNAT family N-acetyltransferase [Anaerolineaceae bacterium]|nr:GNAT family N-acetyltransferase [Anaerolineaceae bacterium]